MFMQSRITCLICKMYVRMCTIRIVIMMINVPCFPYQYRCNYVPPVYTEKQLILIEWKWCRNPYLKNYILPFPSKYLHDNYVIQKSIIVYYMQILKKCIYLLKSLCRHICTSLHNKFIPLILITRRTAILQYKNLINRESNDDVTSRIK